MNEMELLKRKIKKISKAWYELSEENEILRNRFTGAGVYIFINSKGEPMINIGVRSIKLENHNGKCAIKLNKNSIELFTVRDE